jgi:hypothetical protein
MHHSDPRLTIFLRIFYQGLKSILAGMERELGMGKQNKTSPAVPDTGPQEI